MPPESHPKRDRAAPGSVIALPSISRFIIDLSIWAVPTIFAIIAHEVMHGVVARGLGDDTAMRAGRLTLNPFAHIDLFGTVLLPALLLLFHMPVFGYAKPVPVNFGRLRPPRIGMIGVAVAGPLANLVLAALSAASIGILAHHAADPWGPSVVLPLIYMARASIIVNIVLAVFNLLPVPPLDGGRVVTGLLPAEMGRKFARIEPYGLLILLLLLYTNLVNSIINPIIDALARILL